MKNLVILIAIVIIISSFAHKPITWVAIGDSITYFNEHIDGTGNRVTKGYMTRVVEKLPTVHYINQGHNGWTSGDIAKDIDSIDLVKADIFSIFLGTNDWWQGRPIGILADYQKNTGNATVFGSFRIIINKIRNLNKKAKIILITPMQRGDFVEINNMTNTAWGSYKEQNGHSLSEFAAAVKTIATYEHFDLIDLYNKKGMGLKQLVKFKRLKDPKTNAYKNYPFPKYINVPFNPEKDEYPYPQEAMDVTYDGLHPSDKGFGIIAGMLVEKMKNYLK